MADRPLDLDAIRARADAATEGPWIAEFSGETGNCVIPADAQSTREYVARTQLYLAYFDAEFIAHARTDVPRLLAEVERLRAVADITDAATAYVEADPDRDDVPQLWEELRGAVGHYRAVQARRLREADSAGGDR